MEKKEDLISIIIPVYQAERFIEETIKTIKEQKYKNWEAIFVDDNSKDNSVKILEKEVSEKIKLIRLEKNSGPAIARNRGLEESKGRYICFLDADDLWNNEKLGKQLEFMKHKNCAFSYTSFYYINQEGKKCSRKVEIPEKLDYENALKDTRILTIGAMFDLEYIDKELLKMPNIELEDMATWWNILKNGYVAYGLNEPLAYYRKVKGSRGYNKIKSAKNRWKLYRKNEKINIAKSIYYYIFYLSNSIKKRKK